MVSLSSFTAITKELKVLFIDSFYDQQSENETEAFNRNSDILFQFLQNSTKFNTTGITAAQTELGRMIDKVQKLQEANRNLSHEIDVIKNRTYPPVKVTIPVYRTVEPIVVEVTRIVGENVPNSPEKGKSKVLHSNATFIGFGVGMCVLGICIGCISLRMIMNKRNQNSERDECEDGENNLEEDTEFNNGDEAEKQKLNDPDNPEEVIVESEK